jgi:hypothetical protein
MKSILRSLVVLAVLVLGVAVFSHQAATLKHPKIVADMDFVSETGTIPLTTIYTPPANGNFLVTIVVNGDPSSVLTVGTSFAYTTELSDSSSFGVSQSGPGQPYVGGAFPIYAEGGQPMTFQSFVFGSGTLLYNAHVVVLEN